MCALLSSQNRIDELIKYIGNYAKPEINEKISEILSLHEK